ncbi:hypothetical protein EDC04DRAFT_2649455, partial [Pisolithus marmoratus]
MPNCFCDGSVSKEIQHFAEIAVDTVLTVADLERRDVPCDPMRVDGKTLNLLPLMPIPGATSKMKHKLDIASMGEFFFKIQILGLRRELTWLFVSRVLMTRRTTSSFVMIYLLCVGLMVQKS